MEILRRYQGIWHQLRLGLWVCSLVMCKTDVRQVGDQNTKGLQTKMPSPKISLNHLSGSNRINTSTSDSLTSAVHSLLALDEVV